MQIEGNVAEARRRKFLRKTVAQKSRMRTNTAKNMDVRLSTKKFERTWTMNGKEKFRIAALHERLTTRYGMSSRKGGRFFFGGDDEEVLIKVDEERVAKTL